MEGRMGKNIHEAFDVTDINAEMAREKEKKEKEKSRTAQEEKEWERKEWEAKEREAKGLAQAREDLAKISDTEIEGALGNLEAPEELSEEDLEKLDDENLN